MTQHPPEENVAQLHRLALSLLGRPFDLQASQPQLLAGRLPDQLPFTLPLPGDYHIVGSFVRNPEDMQIILDTDLAPASVIAFYTEQMQPAGWTESDFQRRQRLSESGFVHTLRRPMFYTTLCKGLHGPALLVSAVAGQDAESRTDVRLHIDMRSRNSLCRQSSAIFMEVRHLIPSLEPPAGGRQHAEGGGGSNSESAHATARLEVERDMAFPTLANHYARQLEQAGWRRTGEGSTEPMAWHTWEFRDKENEPWGGVFTLLQVPAIERTYYLQILINWLGDRSR